MEDLPFSGVENGRKQSGSPMGSDGGDVSLIALAGA
jgi:hypothetical protein